MNILELFQPVAASGIDTIDPVITGVTVVLTAQLRRVLPADLFEKIRPLLPAVIALIAIMCRAGFDMLAGDGLTPMTASHGLAAGAVGLMGHTQHRKLKKRKLKRPPQKVQAD